MMKGGTWIGPEEIRQLRKNRFRELVKKFVLLFSAIPFLFICIMVLNLYQHATIEGLAILCLICLVISYALFFLLMLSVSRRITVENAEEYIDDTKNKIT